ncbi:MAG: thioredoxin domain-containing protein [Gemmataceae bacterium]|nr:thioredoxin domain-containing protein [Gemmataceae bacterium]
MSAPTRTPNRLAAETSLYLRQHAGNPVDWFPWGPEALARAKELDRPIFLSIGYSACHWCHVMEHESFEDEATAQVMNEHFVCVKVDREERPDIDAIYMTALQALTREGGGWPLSVFLTPDLTPFYAGTYYPPRDSYGRPSFKRLLAGIIDAWQNNRERVTEVGKSVAEFLNDRGQAEVAAGDLGPDLLAGARAALQRSFDPVHGGFGHAPKFPHAVDLKLLLRLAARFGDEQPLKMARLTLDKMARGGMYDQLGGGFARYSVDERWLVPHFEKMLYDNALLTEAYVEAWQASGEPFYRQIAEETLGYVLREMTSPPGAFFSAQDADSEGEEGKFTVWSESEIRDVLGPELGEFACKVWGVTERGNFEGHNILFRARPDEDDARRFGLSVEDFRAKLGEAKCKLYAVRSKRVWPGRDEKILTAWNGLMIGAMARAGTAFGEAKYLDAARRAADYLLANLRGTDGRLYRTAGVGQPAKLAGYLEDYAYLADALVTLYEATFDARYVRAAVGLCDVILKHFADPAGPGFFTTADDHEKLIARMKETRDGSTPSGNAVAVTALLRLVKLTGRQDFAAKAEETLRGFRGGMAEAPAAFGQMLVALDFHLGPVDEVAVVGHAADPETAEVLRLVRRGFHPNRVVAYHDPSTGDPPAEVGLLKDRPTVGGRVTTYVCENSVCRAPLVGSAEAGKIF